MIQITDAMMQNIGNGTYTLDNVARIRNVLTEAGVGDIELHPVEIDAIRRHREAERLARAWAEKLLAAGPMPICTCTLHGDGTVETTNGCKLGHRVGQLPDEVK